MPNPEEIIYIGRDIAELAAGEAKEAAVRLFASSSGLTAAAESGLTEAVESGATEPVAEESIAMMHPIRFPGNSSLWASLDNIPYVGPAQIIGGQATQTVETAAEAAPGATELPMVHLHPVAFPFQPKGIPYFGPAVIVDKII